MNKSTDSIDRRLCVAPMMDWTDRHCRYFLRQMAPDAVLFTEMVTAEALIHGDLHRLLGHSAAETPLVLQLGGSQPEKLAEAVARAVPREFAEINLNVGCPSDRVQSGKFGACLMAEPELVASCCQAMMAETDLPVTVKCRIGIDDMDPESELDRFVDTVAAAGVPVFYLHARKAWLKGLSPKENRSIPPLDYDRARRLAARRGDLSIILNGGLEKADQGSAIGQCSGYPAYGFINRTKALMNVIHRKPFKRVGVPDPIQTGTLPCLERHVLAQCMRDHQNIRKQDRGIKTETT